MPKCTVCRHPQLHDINLAILSGNYTLAGLHQKFGPSPSAFQRHKNHLRGKMVRAWDHLENSQKLVSLLKLNAFLDRVQRGVEAAAADGDIDRVFKGARLGSSLIRQINHLEVSLDLESVYRLISAPGWTSQDSLLPTDPQVITGLHQAILAGVLADCPEPSPEIADEAAQPAETENRQPKTATSPAPSPTAAPSPKPSPMSAKLPRHQRRHLKKMRQNQPAAGNRQNFPPANDAFPAPAAAPLPPASLETQNPELETASPTIDPDAEIRRLWPGLLPEPNRLAAELALLEKYPKNQRQKSGKLPKYTAPSLEKNQQFHLDTLSDKNLPENPAAGRESTAPPAALESPASETPSFADR